MSALRTLLVLGLLAFGVGLVGGGGDLPVDEAAQQRASDERLLKAAGVPIDGPGLLRWFRDRTPAPEKLATCHAALKQLSHESFRVRDKATLELGKSGVYGLRLLATLSDADIETKRRAERCRQAIEQTLADAPSGVAARRLAALNIDGAVDALLAFAPFAESESIDDEIRLSLLQVGLRDGKPLPVIVDAAKDKEPARRAASAFITGQAKDAADRATAAGLLKDADATVRLHAAHGLFLGKDQASLPALVQLIADGPADLLWRIEDLLYRVAGEQSPQISVAGDAANRKAAHRQWVAWWQDHGVHVDLAKLPAQEATLGLTLVAEAQRGDGGGQVVELGRDGKPRWAVKVNNPVDAEWLPGGRFLVADANNNQVLEMDTKGTVLWKHAVNSPNSVQRLPNGNTFIASYTTLVEVTRDGRTVFTQASPGHTYYARKLRNGHIVSIDASGRVTELDDKGKSLQTASLNAGLAWGSIEPLSNGRFLVAQGGVGKVVEMDLAGKVFWEKEVANPNRAVRLPNGNTLVASHNDQCVYEFDRNGREVWKQRLEGRPFSARRR